MSQLKDDCNKEVFIAYNEAESANGFPVKIYITSELMELTDYIRKLIPSLDFETKILHGILTSAAILPKNLKGKTAFIIVEDIYSLNYATISESNARSDKDLVALILSENNSSDIENIYILYGYEISMVLSLDEEELDEEIIDTCQKIVNNVNTIKSLINN